MQLGVLAIFKAQTIHELQDAIETVREARGAAEAVQADAGPTGSTFPRRDSRAMKQVVERVRRLDHATLDAYGTVVRAAERTRKFTLWRPANDTLKSVATLLADQLELLVQMSGDRSPLATAANWSAHLARHSDVWSGLNNRPDEIELDLVAERLAETERKLDELLAPLLERPLPRG